MCVSSYLLLFTCHTANPDRVANKPVDKFSKKKRNRQKRNRLDNEAGGSDGLSCAKKLRPNYFVAIQVNNSQVGN